MDHTLLRSFLPELIAIRHRLHTMPEIGLSEFETSDYIASLLEGWGYRVERRIGQTGLVATLQRGTGNRAIAFRADMDVLPIQEETGLPYASANPGKMHACGHDGHSAMLLGAAHMLARSGQIDGRVNFIFQPAEENFGGAKLMIEDGLFERYPSNLLFALHNMPGLEEGSFATRPGAMMASIDVVTITIRGSGGHGAHPEGTVDPIVVAASTVMALQTLVSRNVSPHAPSVVTVGRIQAGSASNIIPDTAEIEISMRSLDHATRELLRRRVEEIARSQAISFNASAEFSWTEGYPPTVNNGDAFARVERIVKSTFGDERFQQNATPFMGSEDCSFFLEKVPGCFVFIGNGDSSLLHTSTFDFNDAILEPGVSFFCAMAEDYLAP